MAYNPFDFFRKNTKIIMAVITIFIMIMFVLSFGQGDFFQAIPRWLAGWSNSGETVAKIGGSRITTTDLTEVTQRRMLADQIMSQAATMEVSALGQMLSGPVKKLRDKFADQEAMQQQMMMPPGQQAASFRLMSLLQEIGRVEQTGQIAAGQEALDEVARIEGGTKTSPEDKEAATAIRAFGDAVLKDTTRRMANINPNATEASSNREARYFTNQPNETNRDRFNFKLWLKKADQLGIRYTNDDVLQMVQDEFPNFPSSKETSIKELIKLLVSRSNSREVTIDTALSALGDEFRVRAAQAAVLGNNVVRSNFVNLGTPLLDKQKFYNDITEVTKTGLLSVPVAAYEGLVKGEPTEEEINKIYAASRTLVPDPSSPRGGLTEPRKVRVQFVTLTGAEAYYGPLVKAQAKAAPALPMILGGVAAGRYPTFSREQYEAEQANTQDGWRNAANNPGDTSRIAAQAFVLGAAPLAAKNQPAAFNAKPPVTTPQKLADFGIAKVQNAGLLAGVLGGSAATAGSLLTAPVLMAEQAYATERDARLMAGLRAFYVPTHVSLNPFNELAGELAAALALPPSLPQNLIQPYLDSKTEELLRNQYIADDLAAFDAELAKIMAGADKAAAQKQAAESITKFAAARRLTVQTMAAPADVYSIYKDPVLKPLVDKNTTLLSPIMKDLDNDRVQHAFGYSFFNERKPTGQDARSGDTVVPSTGLYDPKLYTPQNSGVNRASDPDRYYVPVTDPLYTPGLFAGSGLEKPSVTIFWRVEDVEAVRPLTAKDPVVREKCVRIWRTQKARELAKAAVENVKKEIDKQVTDGQNDPLRLEQSLRDQVGILSAPIADIREKLKFKFTISDEYDNAKLLYKTSTIPSLPPNPTRFNLVPNDNIVFPTEKLEKEFFNLRDKPIGTSVVGSDKPESHIYLLVVADRKPHPADDFKNFIVKEDPLKQFRSNPQFQMGGTLRDPFAFLSQMNSGWNKRQEAVELLKAEFNVTDESEALDKKEGRE
jgi:SurA N-terminal domain